MHHSSAALCLLGLGLAVSVSAENPIEEIQVTATRVPLAAVDVPTAVTLISSEDIAGEILVTDALAGSAGVYLQQTTSGQGAPIIRGLKGSEVLHLVDGIRLNNAIFRNAPTQYLALVPPSAVERIEVVRGSEASLYGSDAMGGVVQLLTRRPLLEGASRQHRGELRLGADTGELRRSLGATLEGGSERLGALLGLDFLDVGDRRTGGGARIAPSGFESRSGRLAFAGRAGAGLDWLLDVQYLRQPETPRVDELVPGFGQTEPASAEFFFQPNERRFVHLQTRRPDGPLGVDWTWDAAWQQIVDDRRTRDLGATERRLEQNESDLYGIAINGARDVSGTVWTFGAEWYYDAVASRRIGEDITSGERAELAPRFPDGSSVRQGAVYIHLLRDLGPRLGVSGGLRYSLADIRLAAGPLSPGAGLDLDDLSGDLGIVYRLTDQVSLVANVARGFRAPNIFDLGTLGERPGNRFNIANPDLGPERVNQYDVGIKAATSRWRFELVGFRLDYRDRIAAVATGELTPAGRDIVQSRNLAEADIWGIESGLEASLGERVTLSAVVNYTRGEEREAGGVVQPADRIPPLNGRLGLGYRASESLRIEPSVEFAGAQSRLSDRDIRDPRIDPGGTPGWASVNLRLAWQPDGLWLIVLDAENILDKAYRTHGSGLDATGRSLVLNLTRRW